MRAPAVACVIAFVCALPMDASALRAERACPECITPASLDLTHELSVRRARSATRAGAWNEAAELWHDALLIDGSRSAHWIALGEVLAHAERHREAVAAYQRAIQLDARLARDGAWCVARSFAAMSNHRQAIRWLEQALRQGASPDEVWREQLFERYRSEPRLRVFSQHQVEQRGARTHGSVSRSI